MEEASIGLDVGGTHTDLTAISGERVVRANALTTQEITAPIAIISEDSDTEI